jgi:hypothetical protein
VRFSRCLLPPGDGPDDASSGASCSAGSKHQQAALRSRSGFTVGAGSGPEHPAVRWAELLLGHGSREHGAHRCERSLSTGQSRTWPVFHHRESLRLLDLLPGYHGCGQSHRRRRRFRSAGRGHRLHRDPCLPAGASADGSTRRRPTDRRRPSCPGWHLPISSRRPVGAMAVSPSATCRKVRIS